MRITFKVTLRSTLVLTLLCLLQLSGAAFRAIPAEIRLPAPSGPFAVGTITYHWSDRTREEQWTKTPHDSRQLMVQLWYPARSGSAKHEAAYVPELDRLRASIDRYWPDRPTVRTNAAFAAGLSPARRQYPVLVFSHGMNSARFRYTAIIEELASHGYVVAAIDHTYWGPGVAFPNGSTVTFDAGMIARDKLPSNDIDRMMQEGITVMSSDQNFVAQKLAELNRGDRNKTNMFRGRLDLAKMGAIGHSMGGMAATRTCLEYTAFKACLSLDGPNYFLNKMPESSDKPFFLLLNSDWGLGVPERIKSSYLETWSNPLVMIVHGTKHNSFSDIPLTRTQVNGDNTLTPIRAHSIIAAYCVAFFDQSLQGIPGTLLDKNPKRFSEVEFIDLRSLP